MELEAERRSAVLMIDGAGRPKPARFCQVTMRRTTIANARMQSARSIFTSTVIVTLAMIFSRESLWPQALAWMHLYPALNAGRLRRAN